MATKSPKAAAPKAVAAVEFPKVEFPKVDFSQFQIPGFDPSKLEVPAAMREAADKLITQTQAHYAKLKASAEEATDLIEDTYTTVSNGANELGMKSLDHARSNVNTAFDFVREILSVKTIAEALEINNKFAAAQFAALQAQAQDIQTIVQKVSTDTVEPIKGHIEKTFKPAA